MVTTQTEIAAAELMKFTPGDKDERKTTFNKRSKETERYKEPDQLLQARTIINMCFEVKVKELAATPKTMVKLLSYYGDYTAAPHGSETARSVALKVVNKLCSCLRESVFTALLTRAAQLQQQKNR